MNCIREVKKPVNNSLLHWASVGMITALLFSGLLIKAQPGLQLDQLLPLPSFTFSSDLPVLSQEETPASTMLPLYLTPTPEFQVDEMAFFCRIELQLDKWARRNIRFRLGSLDYVNYLEGKTPSWQQ
jgi:hypothetical protein